VKILLLTMARTGSTYLARALYSAMPGNAYLRLEPFNEASMPNYRRSYVDFIIDKSKKKSNVIIKTHLHQLDRISCQDQQDCFLNNIPWYKILLLRKDFFSCVLSNAVAFSIDNFGDKEYKKIDLKIDNDLFLRILNQKINHWINFAKFKKEFEYNQIIYFEDLKFDSTDNDLININFSNSKLPEPTKPTPNDLIFVQNKKELHDLFLKEIKSFSHTGIKNKKGFFELE